MLVTWVINKEAGKNENCSTIVSEWIKLAAPNQNFPSSDISSLERNLLEKTNYRAFRIVSSSYAGINDHDQRPRDLLQFFINNPSPKFTWSCLVNHFFANLEGLKRREVFEWLFATSPTTRFQQLIFISLVSELRSRFARCRGVSKGCTLGASNGQRIGWALQTIMTGWEAFAKYLCFENLQQMIFPFLSFHTKDCHFIPLRNRADGYMPSEYENKLQFPIESTTNASETFKYASEVSDNVDSFLRTLTTYFLEDCISTASNTELYALSHSDVWPLLDQFQIQNNQLPTRFHQLPNNEIENIRKEISRLQLQQPTPGVPHSTTLKVENVTFSSQAINSTQPTSTEKGSSSHRRNSQRTALRQQPSASSSELKRNLPSSSDEDFQPEKKIQKKMSEENLSALLDPLEEFMSGFAKLYCCSYEDLPETHKLMGLEDLSNSVQLLLTDPPYNVRRNRGFDDSAYDSISFEQMKQVATTAGNLLREGGHGIIFCSYDQFALWFDALSIPEIPQGVNKHPMKMFSIDSNPLHIIRHPNFFSTNPGRSSCTLVNTVEYAIHFKKNGLPYSTEATMVSYTAFNHVKSSFQGFRNVIDKVKGLLPGEQVRVPRSDGSGTTKALRNEQKPLALLKELICRFSQPGDIVVDMFSGTFSTAVACFQLKERRRFVGCEQDMVCFDVARDAVTKRFAERITEGADDISHSSSVYRYAEELMKRNVIKKMGDPKWFAPKGLPSFQLFPPQTVRFIGVIGKDISLFTNCADRPFHLWPPKFQAVLQQLDLTQLLTHETASRGLILSSTSSGDGSIHCFTSRSFQKGDVVCYYYGTIVYYDMEKREVTKKSYEEGALGVDLETYRSYAINMDVHGKRFRELERSCKDMKVSLVPAPFCSARHIYNIDENRGSSSTDIREEPNVGLYQTVTNLNQPNKLIPYNLLEVRATKCINSGVKLVLDRKAFKVKPSFSYVIELE